MRTLMPDRFVNIMFQIDTNRINSKQQNERMNRLETWHNDGVIAIDMPEPVTREITSERHRGRVTKAMKYIHSISYVETTDEMAAMAGIEKILFPRGTHNQNQRNDVEIVLNAWKYKRILITEDGDILRNAKRLDEEFRVCVVDDKQAIALVQKRISDRDQMARTVARECELEPPLWVGRD